MKEDKKAGEASGLLTYFPKFRVINAKYFEIKPGFNLTVAGSSNTYGFQLKIRALFEEDLPSFYLQLPRLDYVSQLQTVDLVIDEAELLIRRHVSEFMFENARYKMFLRPEIVERSKDEKEKIKRELVRIHPFVTEFEDEMKEFIRTLKDKRYEISMELAKISTPKRVRGSYSSFPYIKYSKDADRLKKLRANLMKEPAMIVAVEQRDFDLIFSGGEISERVKWTADTNELHYFIDSLNTDKLLKSKIKQPWALTSRLFMKGNGGSFTAAEIRNADEPPTRKDRIDDLISIL